MDELRLAYAKYREISRSLSPPSQFDGPPSPDLQESPSTSASATAAHVIVVTVVAINSATDITLSQFWIYAIYANLNNRHLEWW